MGVFSVFHWLVVLVLVAVMYHGKIGDIMRDLGGRSGGGGQGGGPSHPLPATGKIETSRNSANPKTTSS